ncbi:hypothetical protein ACFLSV_08520, partial [Bacteroidota bacterium]
SFLAFYAIDVSVDVTQVVVSYDYYDVFLTSLTPIFFLILLVLSNIAFMKNDISYFFWMTLFLYVVFTLVNSVYLSGVYFHYKKICGISAGDISSEGIQGLIVCMMAIFICVINYFTLVIMKKKRSMK